MTNKEKETSLELVSDYLKKNIDDLKTCEEMKRLFVKYGNSEMYEWCDKRSILILECISCAAENLIYISKRKPISVEEAIKKYQPKED